MESLRQLFRRARLIRRLKRLELLANYIVEVSVPMLILFSVIRKDVGNLYKWLNVSAQRPSSEPDFARRCKMQNLALIKAFGTKHQPFILITNLFEEYTKKNNRANACLNYIIGYSRTNREASNCKNHTVCTDYAREDTGHHNYY